MKHIRIFLYFLILSALLFVPLERMEIANLEPIQAVWVHQEDGKVILEMDTDDKGSGMTVEDALADAKQNSPGIIYLDTAQYLLVSQTAQQQVAALRPYVKNSVRLCQWEGEGSLTDAVKYAVAHRVGKKIKNWKQDAQLPNLPLLEQEK